jgi:hypothetical protein
MQDTFQKNLTTIVENSTVIASFVGLVTMTPDQTTQLRDALLETQRATNSVFPILKAIRREVFALAPGQTEHGKAAEGPSSPIA